MTDKFLPGNGGVGASWFGVILKPRTSALFPSHSCITAQCLIRSFNPKRCGLLGQLRMRGGVKVSLWQIMVSGHSNFGTDQTNSVSYES